MIPFYLLLGIPTVLCGFAYSKNRMRINNKIPLFVFFSIFIIMLSLRSVTCGIDLTVYRIKFETMKMPPLKSLLDFSLIEPGFDLYMAVCKSLCDDFQFFLAASAIASILPIMFLYVKESEHSLVSISLFVGIAPFTMFFSGLRQSIAMGMGAICYFCCKKNRFLLFLLFVFLAFLFHQSAIILLLMYPLMHIKLSRKYMVVVLILFVICLVFNDKIFEFLLSVSDRYESRYTISNTYSYKYLVLLLMLLFYAFLIPDDSTEIIPLRNLLLLSLMIQCLALVNNVAMRLNYYYLIFIPILIPKVIDGAKAENKKTAKLSECVFVIFFIAWFFKEAYFGANLLHAFPYTPFWKI